jgi:heterodisulfide reductase subunit C
VEPKDDEKVKDAELQIEEIPEAEMEQVAGGTCSACAACGSGCKAGGVRPPI